MTFSRRMLAGVALLAALLGGVWAVRTMVARAELRGRVWRVGVDHAPPYHYLRPDGSVGGLGVDILSEAARRAGVKLTFIPTRSSVDEAFRQHRVDLWPAAADTPERRTWLYVSEPWLSSPLVLLTRTDTNIEQHQQVNGRRVAVQENRQIITNAQRVWPGAQILVEPWRDDVVQSVCSGRADAGFLEARFLDNMLLSRPAGCTSTQFRIVPAPDLRRMLSVVGLRSAAGVGQLLRAEINGMAKDGSLVYYLSKWSAFTASESQSLYQLRSAEQRNQFFLSLIGLLLAAAGVLGWFAIRLRNARREAERASEAKGHFLANMSHEIRTPMTAIQGMSDLLLRSPLPAEERELAQTIRNSSAALLAVINDVLDYSKMEAGSLRLRQEPFDLHELLHEVVALLKPWSMEKGLDLHLSLEGLPRRVSGDPVRLRQILLNLAGNGVKFTESGSVRISGDATPLTGSNIWLRLHVADTGIGISPEARASLFERFSQGDPSLTRRFGGTGLGLAIARNLARLMGGELLLESTGSDGTRFRLELPFDAVADAAGTPSYSTGVTRPLAVLVAEDNPVNQVLVARLLEAEGHSVALVSDGRAAVAAAQSRRFDVILMDLHMPELDGFAATRQIRAGERAERVPIIALTANAVEGAEADCLAAGMDGYLSKPFDAASLRTVLGRWTAVEH